MGTITAFPIPTFNIPTLPDVSPVTDASQFVMERAGTGRVNATALRDYVSAFVSPALSVLSFGADKTGVADSTAAFAAALAAAAGAGPPRVYAPAGTYLLSGITVPAGVAFFGSGADTILTGAGSLGTGNLVAVSGAANVDIGHFTATVSTSSFSSANTIYASGATNLYVHDVVIPSGGAYGVFTTGCADATFSRIRISNAAVMGISHTLGSDVRTVDCAVTGAAIAQHGIQLTSCVGSEVTGCSCHTMVGAGFGINLNTSSFCRIVNNTTYDTKFEGINLTLSNNCTVSSNTVYWSTSPTSSTDFGISMAANSSGNCDQNTFCDNTITNCGKAGIAIAGADTPTGFCIGNIVTGNVISSPCQLGVVDPGPNVAGIVIYGNASANVISGNLIYGDGVKMAYGVVETSAAGGPPTNNRVGPNGAFGYTTAEALVAAADTVVNQWNDYQHVDATTPVGITSAATSNITSLSLPPGNWDVEGVVTTAPAGTTTTSNVYAVVSTASATLQNPLSLIYLSGAPAGSGASIPAPRRRLSLAATTTVYLVTNVGFAVSTMQVSGYLSARRA